MFVCTQCSERQRLPILEYSNMRMCRACYLLFVYAFIHCPPNRRLILEYSNIDYCAAPQHIITIAGSARILLIFGKLKKAPEFGAS